MILVVVMIVNQNYLKDETENESAHFTDKLQSSYKKYALVNVTQKQETVI